MADNLLSKRKNKMKKWNSDMMFPTDSNYVARCINATFGESKSSGNAMITFDWEVVEPQEVEINGEMVNIAGIKTKTYNVVTNFVDGVIDDAKTNASRERVKKLYEDAGLSTEGLDYENLNVDGFKGLAFYVKMDSSITEQRKTPTAAQIEAAKKSGKRAEGDIMKNPVNGKVLVNYYPQVREIFGLCPTVGKANIAF